MLDVRALFPSKYLRVADLNGADQAVTIEKVAKEQLPERTDYKLVAYFQEPIKPLAFNKTNAYTIAEVFGYDADLWVGARLVLYCSTTPFPGRGIVPCIRIRVAADRSPSQPSGSPKAPVEGADPITEYQTLIAAMSAAQLSALQERIVTDHTLPIPAVAKLMEACRRKLAAPGAGPEDYAGTARPLTPEEAAAYEI